MFSKYKYLWGSSLQYVDVKQATQKYVFFSITTTNQVR